MEWQEERRRQSQGGGQKPEEGCPGAGVKEENREVWDPKWYGRPGASGLDRRENGDFGTVSSSPRLLCCIGMVRFKVTRFESGQLCSQ